VSSKIRDTDKGYRATIKRIDGIGKANVTVGIHASDGAAKEGDGATVLDVAVWAEFGTDTEPERSWLRAWFEANREIGTKKLTEFLARVVAGKLTKKQALEQFGAWAQGGIQQRIADGIEPANAPSTIEQKGSSKPLINTGQFRASIHFKVDSK